MITIDDARKRASDLVESGDPTRPIMIMTTPFKLACLDLHLAIYQDAMSSHLPNDELMSVLDEIRGDLETVVTQILQQEFPPS